MTHYADPWFQRYLAPETVAANWHLLVPRETEDGQHVALQAQRHAIVCARLVHSVEAEVQQLDAASVQERRRRTKGAGGEVSDDPWDSMVKRSLKQVDDHLSYMQRVAERRQKQRDAIYKGAVTTARTLANPKKALLKKLMQK